MWWGVLTANTANTAKIGWVSKKMIFYLAKQKVRQEMSVSDIKDETMVELLKGIRSRQSIDDEVIPYMNIDRLRYFTMTLVDYTEYIWDEEISIAGEPWKWYIDTGKYIAGEKLADVIGFSINDKQEIKYMTKLDWKYMGESLNSDVMDMDEYYVIKLTDFMEEANEIKEDGPPLDRWCDDMDEWIHYQLTYNKPPEGLTNRELDLLEYKIALYHERKADIERGK